jgi:hypothetical protein
MEANMSGKDFRTIRKRLEETVLDLPGIPRTAAEVYERYRQVAQTILREDEHQFKTGVLRLYLKSLLYERRLLLDLDTPREAGEV